MMPKPRPQFDADPAGDDASAKATSEFRAFGCEVERWRPSRKDWNEVLVAFGSEALQKDLVGTHVD
jgi:DNA primase